MIDLHTHILPALDDGAATVEESVAMARAAVAEGIAGVAATPHVRDDYPTTAAEMERAVIELRSALAAERVRLEVLTGGEIAVGRLEILEDDELARFALGGGRYLLLEFPYRGWPLQLESVAFALRSRGFGVVLAHPERNGEATPARLRRLVDRGVLVQITSASVDGRLGRASRTAALRLIELELAHLIASDAHTPELRAGGLKAAAEMLRDEALAAWLTVEVPLAIVSGDPPPKRPSARRRTRRIFRR